MSNDDQTTIDLAEAHRVACEAVDPAWRAVLATPPATPERTTAIAAYNAASHEAYETRERLLVHVRGKASEVGG